MSSGVKFLLFDKNTKESLLLAIRRFDLYTPILFVKPIRVLRYKDENSLWKFLTEYMA